jgi:hypothetical protein
MPALRRWSLVALALAAASCLSIAGGGGRWWSGGDFDLGPFGARQCRGDDCIPASLPLEGGERWQRAATATGAACLIASFALLLVAAGLAAGRTSPLLAKLSLSAVATCLLAGALFVVWAPAIGGFAFDRGFYLWMSGLALGCAVGAGTLVSSSKR